MTTVITTYDDPDEYWQDYMRSDHHWNARGAVSAYNLLADAWGLRALGTDELRYLDGGYLGSRDRAGLVFEPDRALDVAADYSVLEVERADGTTVAGDERPPFEAASDIERLTGFYTSYFGMDAKVFTNRATASRDEAILVSDSYGATFIWPLALDMRRVERKRMNGLKDQSLAAYLEETGANRVVFVEMPNNYATILDANPDFFAG